jgi:8-oxo-dGTP diphosphatase
MAYTYEYPRPALTVDCAVFRPADGTLELLLVERDEDPHAGCWATPGGFVEIRETVDDAAFRELREETSLDPEQLRQYGVFSEPGRDPRGRVISHGYWTLVPRSAIAAAASDARETAWHRIDELPTLAFDHDQIASQAIDAIRHAARTGPVGFELLKHREPFDWPDVIGIYECILETPINEQRLTDAWSRADLVDEQAEGLVCHESAYRRAERNGLSHWTPPPSK